MASPYSAPIICINSVLGTAATSLRPVLVDPQNFMRIAAVIIIIIHHST